MYQRILVPIDGSSTSSRGLSEAIRLAKLTGGRLRLVHVIDELSFALAMDAYAGYAGNWLEELRASAAKLLQAAQAEAVEADVEADTVLLDRFNGTVHDQIIAEAEACKAELIVIGTHGRRGIGRWVMGSSAEHILRISPVPVLLVRAPESAHTEHERFALPSGTLAGQ
ncbi:universal stress protein [Variovorax ginsengisoli]|uniref:Nucleotide-binding universal stress UspA family protein n=1 Tax=Variovorax ginsengisoli TaxID=363844 RepID=A0ABT9S2X4_9BURK|nr:universal stress protein [Variovorax ginsengisoli]MDP9898706.1 nucleotide-binding universal stress UspA family protein [Variovorax ginsengisoli]